MLAEHNLIPDEIELTADDDFKTSVNLDIPIQVFNTQTLEIIDRGFIKQFDDLTYTVNKNTYSRDHRVHRVFTSLKEE